MASCSLGASNVKVPNLGFGTARISIVQPRYGIYWTCQRPPKHAGLVLSQRAKKTLCCDSSAATKTAAKRLEDGSEKTKSSGVTRQLIPNSTEVETLLSEICDTTSIAEFELKLDGFRLYVTRNLTSKSEPPQSAATVSSDTKVDAPNQNGSASTSLALSKTVPSLENIATFLDRAADDGVVIVKSPKVGLFRRSRTLKRMILPPACKENQTVKEGRVVCFIEQLGLQSKVQTEVSGQVVKILKKDGEPVGYGDPLIAILPSFPGIKKLK